MKNEIDIASGLRVPLQIPLDVKAFCPSELVLSNLGAANNLAYTYYDGLIVLCQEERTKWEWQEVKEQTQEKLLVADFTYPANWIVYGKNYSLKKYNFFAVFNDYAEIEDRLTVLENQTYIDNVFITMPAWSSASNWLKIHAGGKWKYNGVINENLIDFEFTVVYSDSGKQRLVYFVPNGSNGFTEISGPQSVGIAKAPLLPVKDFFYTYFLVTDSSIGEPTTPTLIKTPTIQQVLESGFDTNKIMWFWNTLNSKCLQLSSESVYFQKLESVFNWLKADHTTQSYTAQLPNKLGGAEQTFAMISDLENIGDQDLQSVLNKGSSAYDTSIYILDSVGGGDVEIHPTGNIGVYGSNGNAFVGINSANNNPAISMNYGQGETVLIKPSENTSFGATVLLPINSGTLALVSDIPTPQDISGKQNQLTAGANITIDATNPLTPIISATASATVDISGKVDKVAGERLINAGEIVKLSNTSNTNTGDETTSTIKTKLSITTLSGANTGDQDLSEKVDKVTGKSLLSDTEIARLAGVVNFDGSTKQDKFIIDESLHYYQDELGNKVLASNISAITSSFVWEEGNSTIFILPFLPTNLLGIFVNGLKLYKTSQYTIILPNQIEILQTLFNQDVVQFNYEHYNTI